MHDVGKSLILIGIIVTFIGVAVSFTGKIPWIGHLPGDFFFKKGNVSFYVPLASCILISLLFSFIFWLLRR